VRLSLAITTSHARLWRHNLKAPPLNSHSGVAIARHPIPYSLRNRLEFSNSVEKVTRLVIRRISPDHRGTKRRVMNGLRWHPDCICLMRAQTDDSENCEVPGRSNDYFSAKRPDAIRRASRIEAAARRGRDKTCPGSQGGNTRRPRSCSLSWSLRATGYRTPQLCGVRPRVDPARTRPRNGRIGEGRKDPRCWALHGQKGQRRLCHAESNCCYPRFPREHSK